MQHFWKLLEAFYLITLFKGGPILFFTTLKNQVKDNLEYFITSLDLSLERHSIFVTKALYKSSASTGGAVHDYVELWNADLASELMNELFFQ